MAKRNPNAVLLVAIALGFALCLAAYVGIHLQRWRFEQQISVHLSKNEVVQGVGNPAEVLASGEQLPSWGGKPARTVSAETWVYFVWPNSQHRYVLTFRDDRVSALEHQQN